MPRRLRRPLALALILLAGAWGRPESAWQDVTAPVWARPDHFWFRKAVPGGHVWLTVDAAHGVKEPLFDHQRLAIELGVRNAGDFSPLTLPFADPAAGFTVKYDGSNAYVQEGALAIEFNLEGRFWRCDLQIKWNWNLVPPTDYECLPRGPARAVATAVEPPTRPSPDGRRVALVRDHNVWVGEAGAAPRALTQDGTAQAAYLPGSLRWSADSRTLTAYRVHEDVWRADGVAANVKALVQAGRWTIAPADR
jgi:hypothetical protein